MPRAYEKKFAELTASPSILNFLHISFIKPKFSMKGNFNKDWDKTRIRTDERTGGRTEGQMG